MKFQEFVHLIFEYFPPYLPEYRVTLSYFIHSKFPCLESSDEMLIYVYAKSYGFADFYFDYFKPLMNTDDGAKMAPELLKDYMRTAYGRKISKVFRRPKLFTTFKPLGCDFFANSLNEAKAPALSFSDNREINYFNDSITNFFLKNHCVSENRISIFSVSKEYLVELDFPEQINYVDGKRWDSVLIKHVNEGDRCFYIRDPNWHKSSMDNYSFGILALLGLSDYGFTHIRLFPGKAGLAVYDFTLNNDSNARLCLLYLWIYFSSNLDNKRKDFLLREIFEPLGVIRFRKTSTMTYSKESGFNTQYDILYYGRTGH